MSTANQFLYRGMTPRAWRMISYSCIGFLIYGMIVFGEMLQSVQLSRIDSELKAVEEETSIGTEKYQVTPTTPTNEPQTPAE